MAAPRPTILLTGFAAFPGVERNATAELIPQIAAAARQRFPAHDVIGEVLPVEWSRAPLVLEELLTRAPVKLALHFGVSHHASGFQIELVGRNLRQTLQDAMGELPGAEQVIRAGPALLAATLPAERIIARLRSAGIPCCTSNDAGAYLCNALLYHSIAAARALPVPYLSGFVHLPASLACGPGALEDIGDGCRLTWTAAVAGSLEIIAACIDHDRFGPHQSEA